MLVLPIFTAVSQSPDMPMLSSSDGISLCFASSSLRRSASFYASLSVVSTTWK